MSTTQTVMKDPAPSDEELIVAVRAGDSAAFAALYERHALAAHVVARQYLPSGDADDVIGDAFTRVLDILKSGGGPQIAFRAYLFIVVRRLCHDHLFGARRTAPTADQGTFESAMGPLASAEEPTLRWLERSLVTRAFQSLPQRWQSVLWYTEVEDMSPAQVAPILGLSPNGVAALSYRAREGLRQAYLHEHLSPDTGPECAQVNPLLASYVRDGLTEREHLRVDQHVTECVSCSALVLELDSLSHGMRAVVAPLILGTGAVGLVGTALPVGGASALSAGFSTAGTDSGAAGSAASGSGSASAASAGAGAAGGGGTMTGAGSVAGVGSVAGAGATAGATGLAALFAGSPLVAAGLAVGVAIVAVLGLTGVLRNLGQGDDAAELGPVVTATAEPSGPDEAGSAEAAIPGGDSDDHGADPPDSSLPGDLPDGVPAVVDPGAPWVGPFTSIRDEPGGGSGPATPHPPAPDPPDPPGITPTPRPPTEVPPSSLSLSLRTEPMVARVPGGLSLVAANTGGSVAEHVVVDVVLPPGVTVFDSAAALLNRGPGRVDDATRCASSRPEPDGSNLVTCNVGTLDAGSSVPLELTVVAASEGNTTINGSIWAKGSSVVHQRFAPVPVSSFGPQLRIGVMDDVVLANPGVARIVVPVRNEGDRAAQGATVTLASLAGLHVSGLDGWTCEASVAVVCVAPDDLVVEPGRNTELRMSVIADGAPRGGVQQVTVDAVTSGGRPGGSGAGGVTVESPWAGADADVSIACVGPDVPGRSARIVAQFEHGSSRTQSVLLRTDYGASERRTLDGSQGTPVRVALPVPALPWTPGGKATVVVERVVAGVSYLHEIVRDYPTADCYVPAWDAQGNVRAEWVNGSVHLIGELRNDTDEPMLGQLRSSFGSADPQQVGPGGTVTFTVDTGADAVVDGTVIFGQSRTVGGREHHTTIEAAYSAVAYAPDWTVDVIANLTCVADSATLEASVSNRSGEAMTVSAKTRWGTGPAQEVAAGAGTTFAVDTGSVAAAGGTVAFRLSRSHGALSYDAEATAGFVALDCSVRDPDVQLVLGAPTYDTTHHHSYRGVSVALDNSGSNVPVAFSVSGEDSGATVTRTVPARQSVTVPVGEAPWTGASYTVTAEGRAAPAVLTVDPFTAAPACARPWLSTQWYDHTARASYLGWNYDARNSGIGVRPNDPGVGALFWLPVTRCGQG